jgi:vacuolar-type H+-ATPase subunit E/Vma4
MMSNSEEGREMDTESSANVDGYRTDVYRGATDAASAERREIQAEIAHLEARVSSLQARDASLEVLVSALRELLPASPEVALRYTPTYSIADGASEFPRRSAVDAESRHDVAFGIR